MAKPQDQPIRLNAKGKVTHRPTAPKSVGDYLALAVATCGVGYMPIAPGTWGSAVGVGLYLVWRWVEVKFFLSGLRRGIGIGALYWLQTSAGLLLLLVTMLVGIWAANRAVRLLGRKDPGQIVIDEVAGQAITLAILPSFAGWKGILAGFLLFRAFDIWKPFPIRKLEQLPEGLGVVMDDVLAGMYAAIVLSILLALRLLI
ncbi:MAG: phosphatidylglycerophosphatase A [Pyrinomonadaceae bacterium]